MAAWIWFGLFGVLTNLAAIALLWGAFRTSVVERLAELQRYAVSCAVLAMFGFGLGVAIGLLGMFSAVGGESVDPSQRARILAEGLAEAINCAAIGVVTAPLPLAALIAIALRTRRLRRASAVPT